MARVALTYEQVAEVANALCANGIKHPGTKAIREELARRAGPGGTTGSPNTIQRHLNEWRLQSPPGEPTAAPQLPPQLVGEIARAMKAAAAAARDDAEARVFQLQSELAELVATAEANDAREAELVQALAMSTSARDSMEGQLTVRESELSTTSAALAAALQKCADLEREVHAAKGEAQASSVRVEEIRQALERQLAEKQSDLDLMVAAKSMADRQAQDAEVRAAGAEARLEGESSARLILEANISALHASVKKLEVDAARASAAEATAVVLREQLVTTAETVKLLQGLVGNHESRSGAAVA